MPTVTYPSGVEDLVNSVVKNFYPHRHKWTDISLNFTKYLFADKLLNKARMVKHEGGTQITWKVQVRNISNVREVGLFDENTPARNDLFVEASTDFVSQSTGTFWDVNEKVFNKGPVQIIDHIKGLMHAMYNDWFEAMEYKMWTSPATSADADKKMLGISHWIVKETSTAAFGFNGGNPANFSAGAGNISSSTYPRWDNGTGIYTAVDDAMLELLTEAMDKTKFVAPHSYPAIGDSTANQSLITTYPVIQGMRELTRVQNENIGKDLGKFRDTVIFRGVEVIWAEALTTALLADGTANPAVDTSDPIYGIDWTTFNLALPNGKEREVTGPQVAPLQRHVREIYVDAWNQLYCTNRRRNFVIQKAA